MSKKKVIVFGCQQIAIDLLKYLVTRHDVEIPLVVTYEVPPDLARGQDSVIRVAKKMGLETVNPQRISAELIDQVRAIAPDLILSVYYRKIFPQSLLDIPPLGAVNVHPSLLPAYRGPIPTAWAILNGETEFGITLHEIDAGVDTGDILVQQSYAIGPDETGFELYLRAMELGAEMLTQNFEAIINGTVKARPQPPGGSYYGKMDEKVFIDWRKPAEEIRSLIRIRAKPHNPAETLLMSKYVFINRASIYDGDDLPTQRPGRILKILPNDHLVVSCADGALVLEEYDIYPKLTDMEHPIHIKQGNSFSNGR